MTKLTLILSIALVAYEFQNLLAWWRGRTIRPRPEGSDDFTIVVPLFGHPRYFEGRAALLRYQQNVLVALEVSTPLMAGFANQLEEEGWRVERLRLAGPNPATLVKAALPAVTTTYVLRLDADTAVGDDIPGAVAAAAEAGADLCSMKCGVLNRVNVVTRLQALEYRMAMLARHFRPWLTSGACFLARTDALRAILDRHSLWTPGEDIETGRIALALKMKIRHLDTVVETEAPDTWRALARQRRLWWAGNFRHFWINLDRNILHLPVMTAYSIAVIWASLYFKAWTLLEFHQFVRTFPLVLVSYVFVTAVANMQVISPWMLVFPIYSMLQVLVMPPVGAVYYVVLARRRGRLGRYGFGYRRRRLDIGASSTTQTIVEGLDAPAAASPRPSVPLAGLVVHPSSASTYAPRPWVAAYSSLCGPWAASTNAGPEAVTAGSPSAASIQVVVPSASLATPKPYSAV